MALISCPECKREISDKADSCPQCGYPISTIVPITTREELLTSVVCLKCGVPYAQNEKCCPHCNFTSSQVTYINSSSNKSIKPNYSVFYKLIFSLILAAMTYAISLYCGANESTWLGDIILWLTFVYIYAYLIRSGKILNDSSNNYKLEKFIYSTKSFITYFALIIIVSISYGQFIKYADKIKTEKFKVIRIENENKDFQEAKRLLKESTLDNNSWKVAASKLEAVSIDNPLYNEAQHLLPPVKVKLDEIQKQEKELDRKAKEDKEKAEKANEEAGLTLKGKKLRAKYPHWNIDDVDTISRGRAHIGMTTEQVAAAWGRPYKVNRSIGSYGTHEQWVMHEYGNTYVYFQNGICTSMQGVD